MTNKIEYNGTLKEMMPRLQKGLEDIPQSATVSISVAWNSEISIPEKKEEEIVEVSKENTFLKEVTEKPLPLSKVMRRWTVAYETLKNHYPEGITQSKIDEEEKLLATKEYVRPRHFKNFLSAQGYTEAYAFTLMKGANRRVICGKKYLHISSIGKILNNLGYSCREEAINYLTKRAV